MGVGNGLLLQPAMVAGAIVSGAYFGDKMSPLSDSTNLAPAVTGVELFDHIRHMVFTTAPAFAISLVLYSIIGYFGDHSDASSGEVLQMQRALSNQFKLSPLLLLAPTVVIVLSVMRVTALPALVAAVGTGAILAISLQEVRVAELIGVMHFGYESSTGLESMDELLSGGGLDNMMWTVSLILCALSLGGIMEGARVLESVASAILKASKGSESGCRDRGTSIATNIVAPDQYLSIIVPGRMYRDAYQERNLEAKNLSRTIEDGGTLSSPLVPGIPAEPP